MIVVNRSDAYRVAALIELAAAFPEPLTAPEIARRRGIPAPFLGRLLAGLARAGVVITSRGPRGGVRLARAPADIPLAAAFPEAAPVTPGDPAVVWFQARLAEARRAVLQRTTLAGLLAVEREHRAETDWEI